MAITERELLVKDKDRREARENFFVMRPGVTVPIGRLDPVREVKVQVNEDPNFVYARVYDDPGVRPGSFAILGANGDRLVLTYARRVGRQWSWRFQPDSKTWWTRTRFAF